MGFLDSVNIARCDQSLHLNPARDHFTIKIVLPGHGTQQSTSIALF